MVNVTSPLSLADSAWLHMERPNNLMTICGLLTFDQLPDHQRLLALLQHRLCAHLRFRSRVVESPLSLPHWEELPHFDLNDHLIIEELSDPGPECLMDRVSELMSQPLDRSRPLWEFRLFPGAHTGVPGEHAAMLVRLHHAIGDGISLMRVLLNLADLRPDEPWPAPLQAPKPTAPLWERARRMTERWLHRGHDALFHPAQLLEVGKSLARVLALPPDRQHPLKGEVGEEKRATTSIPLDLEEVKQKSKRLGCTVNDVLMGALAGALGRTLARRMEVPEDMELRAVVPVDLRGGDCSELSNRFGMVFLRLPVGCTDPAQRLVQTRANMAELKNSPEALVTYEVLSAVGATPREFEAVVIDWFGNKASAVVTNLPGPRQPLYLGKARIESVMYWVPQSGHLGLGISFLSYAGRIRLGIASDVGLLPDPEELQRDFLECYQEFESI